VTEHAGGSTGRLKVALVATAGVAVLELVGGALLISGLFTRPAAFALAGDMVGAIIVSGIAKGELISLTLAPAELVAMLVLLRTGPGGLSLKRSPSAPLSVRPSRR